MCIKKYLAAVLALSMLLSPVRVHAKTELAPNVTPEMTSAKYWNDRNPKANVVLMDAAKIEKLNKEIKAKDTKLTGFRNLNAIDATFNGEKLISQLVSFNRERKLYLDGELLTDDYYDEVAENIKGANLGQFSAIKYGIITERTVIKQMPEKRMLSDSPTDPEWDEICDTALRVGEPIVYYFTTGDGKFAYIMSEYGPGFIPVEDFGFCKDKTQWINAKNHEEFLVVTGEKIYLEESVAFPESSEKMLTMGTVLELSKDFEGSVSNRLPWNSYVVKLPYRDADGNLAFGDALIPANRDVNEGYLTLTSGAVIEQAFKCLGNRYGWGGMMKADDCSQFIMNVYKCFGLNIPRNTTWQANMPVEKIDISDLCYHEKSTILAEMTPGTIIQFPGHEMMLLGVIDGKVYTINDVSSIADPTIQFEGQEKLSTSRVRSVIVNEMDSTRRANTKTWLESATRIIDLLKV